MRTLLLVALMLALSLSGCTRTADDRSAADDPDLPVQADPAAELLALDNSGSGCAEAVAILLVPMERAAAMLPHGFAPADAQALLGTPAPTGQGAAVLATYMCAEWSGGDPRYFGSDLNVLVERPDTADAPPADNHFYQVVHYATDADEIRLLGAIGWKIEPGTSTITIASGTTGAVDEMTATVENDNRTILSYGITAAAPNTLTGTSRFWHVTSGNGTWYVDFDVDVAVLMGQVTCTFGPGSPAAELLGGTACDEAVGAIMSEGAWGSRYGRIDG